MTKRQPSPPIKVPDNEAQLLEWYTRFNPASSGPLSMMVIARALIKEVATLRGYGPDWPEKK